MLRADQLRPLCSSPHPSTHRWPRTFCAAWRTGSFPWPRVWMGSCWPTSRVAWSPSSPCCRPLHRLEGPPPLAETGPYVRVSPHITPSSLLMSCRECSMLYSCSNCLLGCCGMAGADVLAVPAGVALLRHVVLQHLQGLRRQEGTFKTAESHNERRRRRGEAQLMVLLGRVYRQYAGPSESSVGSGKMGNRMWLH